MTSHVVLAIDVITPPEMFPGDASIRGRVIHVFEGTIPLGSTVEVTQRTARRSDAGTSGAYSFWETIRDAKFLDAYLSGSPDHYTIAGGGAMFLSAMPPNIRPPKDPVDSAATAAITTSAIGCGCGPFAILGAIFALKAMSQARRSGRPAPSRAIVALVLAGVVLIAWIFVAISWMKQSRKQQADQQKIGDRLKGKREAASLDQEAACDLVRERLVGNTDLRADAPITCHGPFEQTATTAMLKDVDVEFTPAARGHLTACFGRTSHWFVMGMMESDIPCPAVAFSASGDEKSIRESAAETFDRAETDAYARKMEAVKQAVTSAKPGEHPCEALDIVPFAPAADTDKELKPAAFDISGDPGWQFMTAREIRDVASPNLTPHGRADSVHHLLRASGPYLVVYSSERRSLPVIHKKKGIIEDDFSYEPGEFAGWMTVVDTRTAKTVCQGKLEFANSEKVRYSSRGPSSAEDKFRSAVQDDLEEQFKDTATEKIKKMSDGKLKLGYKFLE